MNDAPHYPTDPVVLQALVPLMGASQDTVRAVTLPDGSTAYEHTFTPPSIDDLPVLDWRPVQYALMDISDWIDDLAPKIADLFRDLAPTVRTIQRSRLRAAKTRARLSTQVRQRRRR